VRDVAGATGAQAVILRTNLREHPLVAGINWERAHGGALAAAGHLIGRAVGSLAISSGLHRADARPWGSHWELDPLWSSSSLRVRHVGDDLWHITNTRQLADDPLAQRHLRVCWERHTAELNCAHCDKCLITMAVLDDEGALERFEGFHGGREALAEPSTRSRTRATSTAGRGCSTSACATRTSTPPAQPCSRARSPPSAARTPDAHHPFRAMPARTVRRTVAPWGS
jgi:hypothetical protein